ncbi:unnamed protein product [Sphagnum troendelagicum]|uniref:Uncharacterized protein n=1 Tax=Sphagnum troendelagicum TaxID=128251 RepID=A0ABP0UVH2_9BRYO
MATVEALPLVGPPVVAVHVGAGLADLHGELDRQQLLQSLSLQKSLESETVRENPEKDQESHEKENLKSNEVRQDDDDDDDGGGGGSEELPHEPFLEMLKGESTRENNSGQLPTLGLTENLSTTFLESGNACLDFFFQVVPRTSSQRVAELLELAWKEDASTALKLVFQLRAVRGTGKSDKESFYTAALWLYHHHPSTLLANLGCIPAFGYYKDLLELVLRIVEGPQETQLRLLKKEEHDEVVKDEAMKEQARKKRRIVTAELAERAVEKYSQDSRFKILHSAVAQIFADQLAKDVLALAEKRQFDLSLAAKWAPSLDQSYDKRTLMCESIARRLFLKSSFPEYADLEDAHYAYRVRDRLRKEVLVPLRRCLELPEVYMSARRWEELPYNRVASVAMKNYKEIFEKKDPERFKKFLEDVTAGKAKLAAGALLPHQIVQEAVEKEDQGEAGKVSELQWKRLVEDMKKQGSLSNCMAVCDVSGSMAGVPMEVCIALGLLVSDLCEQPWKNHIMTFSSQPQLHLVKGETIAERHRFTKSMDWGFNTDFQAVFDIILSKAVLHSLPPEKMIKRLFVFSDMEFDEATQGEAGSDWEATDYMVICNKFKKAGYGDHPPQIVFWNLRDSRSTPVVKNQKGVAMVSGFSKNLLKVFLQNDGEINPMLVMQQAIAGPMYQELQLVD